MEYIVEISTMSGHGVGSEEYSRIVSESPLPVPNPGDIVYVPDGGGPNGDRPQKLEVVNRLFMYSPAGERTDACAHVQVFCRDANPAK